MLWYIRYLQKALEKKSVPTLDMIQAKLERACKEALAYLAKAGRDGHIEVSRNALAQAPIPEVGDLAAVRKTGAVTNAHGRP